MSLYLCVFDSDHDVNGVDVGFYSDFNAFRETICNVLENEIIGSKFPTLMLHSDCDGQWDVAECRVLEKELHAIASVIIDMQPRSFNSEWQENTAKLIGIEPKNLYETFIDVDGEPLIARLIQLCQSAQKYNQPILFQ